MPPLATYSLSGDKRSEGKPLKHFEELGSTCRDGKNLGIMSCAVVADPRIS